MDRNDSDAADKLGPPLVRRLLTECNATWVDETSVEQWAAQQTDAVVLLAGHPRRFPEGQDVAVVLPELQKSFPDRFTVAIVPRDSEQKVAELYGAMRFPALVFLRGGQYVTTISGMQDWDVYLDEVAQALDKPVSRPPTVGIPVVSGAQTS